MKNKPTNKFRLKRLPACLLLFCLSSLLHGQNSLAPLKPGDPVPDLVLEELVNYPGETGRLSDFNGKLLILDFWATWCRPCVEALPRFQQLQRDFDGQLRLLLVSSQAQEAVARFLSARNISLPSVTGDKTLSQLFPHRYVPHEVWIKDGKVLSITGEAEVTAANIKNALSDRQTSLPEKKSNFDYELTRPLLVGNNGGQATDLLYHSVITGYLDGIGGGGVYTDSLGRFRLRALNGTVVQLYQAAMRYLHGMEMAQANRCILDFDKQDVLPPPGAHAWPPAARGKYYSYELLVPPALKEQAGRLMLDDLNRFFGALHQLHGAVEKRTVNCWALKSNGAPEMLTSQSVRPENINDQPGRLVYRKQPFQNFSRAVVGLFSREPYPVIDRTGITGEIDIAFPTNEKDIRRFSAFLEQYGLRLEQELCEIDMLVIRQSR